MIPTPWGYSVDAQTLPDIVSVAEFNAATGNRYAGSTEIEPALKAAQEAIRNYCGWHISPSLKCTFTDDTLPRKRVIQLPATHVASVTSVTVDGQAVTFRAKTNGLVRTDAPMHRDEWQDAVIVYQAGIDDCEVVKDLIIHRATHALAVPAGVQSETAGGVSITYTASWTSNNRATNLPDDNLSVLSPYRARAVV